MHPHLVDIPLPWVGAFPVKSYGFMIVCGFLLCLWLLQRRGKRMGLDPLALFDLAVAALLGGLVGARLFYVIDNWEAFSGHPWRIIRLDQGGLAFFGGLIGGALGALWSARRKKLPVRATLDVAAGLVPLGHAFGRLGCFLFGCCFGKITHSWIGMRFPRVLDKAGYVIGSPPFLHHKSQGLVALSEKWSLPVHPTQLYEVGYNLVFFAILTYVLPRRRRAGDVAWLYAILYGCARFANEFFRADTLPQARLGGLTIFQVIAGAAVVFGIAMLARSLRRPAEPIPDPWQPPGEARPAG
ncbi:MAG: prolipoprotein diacylglyceryl transferase [Planctomycetota bacterium]|jgi:phosphatidylglycerol:prolipoprotein diacylglycerol transferase